VLVLSPNVFDISCDCFLCCHNHLSCVRDGITGNHAVKYIEPRGGVSGGAAGEDLIMKTYNFQLQSKGFV
jgi:hypothetical protein